MNNVFYIRVFNSVIYGIFMALAIRYDSFLLFLLSFLLLLEPVLIQLDEPISVKKFDTQSPQEVKLDTEPVAVQHPTTLLQKQEELKRMANHCKYYRPYPEMDRKFRKKYNSLEKEIKQEIEQYLTYFKLCFKNSVTPGISITNLEKLLLSNDDKGQPLREFLLSLISVMYDSHQKLIKDHELLLLENETLKKTIDDSVLAVKQETK